jgi:hypothetical protein
MRGDVDGLGRGTVGAVLYVHEVRCAFYVELLCKCGLPTGSFGCAVLVY